MIKIINIAICDDDQIFLQNNQGVLDTVIKKLRIATEIYTYINSSNLLADIIDDNKHFDLILLDIEMPIVTGIEIANAIKPHLPNVKIIFITSHMDYVLDAFELSIYRYVPKTDETERLSKAIYDALNFVILENDKYYQIKSGGTIRKIKLKDVYYIKREGKNSAITFNDRIEKVRKPLKEVFDDIAMPEFLYIDRGVIVNIIHVMKIEDGYAFMKSGEKLDISRSHMSEVKQHITKYWGEHL